MSRASKIALTVAWVLIAGAVAWAILTAVTSRHDSVTCPSLPRARAIEDNIKEFVKFSFSAQGKAATTYVGDRGSTALGLRQKLQSAERDMAPDRRGIVYLLAKSAGANDSPAIALQPGDKRPFACFLRVGDVVMLRGYVSHWTTVSAVDSKAGVVQFFDPWPDRFPFLKTHSSGDFGGGLVKADVGTAVSMPFGQVDKLLLAILTTDGPELAQELARPSCACINDVASLQGVFDTLLERPEPARLQMAIQIATSLKTEAVDSLRPTAEAYQAAASLLQTISGTGSEASATMAVEGIKKHGNDTFMLVSPATSLRVYEAIDKEDDRLGQIVSSAVNSFAVKDRFNAYQRTRIEYFRGQHFAADGKEDVAIDYLKFAVRRLDEWWTRRTSKAPVPTDQPALDESVLDADTYEMYKLVVEGRAALAVYYARAKNVRAAASHFNRLLELRAPYPTTVPIRAALEICKHDPRAVSKLKAIDPKASLDQVKSQVKEAVCLSQS